MKYAILVLVLISMSGCGFVQRQKAHWGGHTKVCVEGITYLQFPTGTTVQVDKDGKPVPCK